MFAEWGLFEPLEANSLSDSGRGAWLSEGTWTVRGSVQDDQQPQVPGSASPADKILTRKDAANLVCSSPRVRSPIHPSVTSRVPRSVIFLFALSVPLEATSPPDS